MSKRRILSFVIAMMIVITSFISTAPAANAATTWDLVWSDEFNGANGTGVDTSKWAQETGGGGWGNGELQNYTNRTNNAYMENGSLVIKAIKESYGGSQYTSARLKTQGKYEFTYGKVEMRAQLPYGQGIWPAFWMLGTDIGSAGWPNCGEIDIMEYVGKDPTHVYGTIHGPGYSGGGGIGASFTNAGGFSNAYHIYTIEWEKDVIRWYVDGILYETRTPADLAGKTWVYNHNFFILLNLAVGGAWPGNPDASTVFPQYYKIDYVRVYKAGTTTTPTPTPTPPAGSSKIAIKALANNMYVCADNAGANPLLANRTAPSTWEQFERINLGNGKIALKSLANGKYVCADNAGASALIAKSTAIGAWETFTVVNTSDGKIALKADANGKYVCADNAGANPLIANRDSYSTWEKFEFVAQ